MLIALFLLTGCGRQKPMASAAPVKPGPPKPVPMRPDIATGVGHRYRTNVSDELLKGIVWDDKKPYAIIGAHVVVVGDYIDEKKVIKISQDTVVLEYDGQYEVLHLQ
jgi:hypothetical protein